MLKNEAIQIRSIRGETEGKHFIVRITVYNPEDRTLHAYGSPRRVFYDNASGRLTLLLHDRNLPAEIEELIAPHLRQPRFVPLEGKAETEIKIKLPQLMHRLRPSTERADGPLFEELRVSEAKEVEAEIAHQDTPFYYNPNIGNARQLQEWGTHLAKATFKINPPKPISTEEPRVPPKSRKPTDRKDQ